MNRAGRAVMAMVAGALMLSAGPAVAGEPGLELIGTTQIPFDSRFEGITIGGLSGLDRLRGDQYLAFNWIRTGTGQRLAASANCAQAAISASA